MAGSTQHAQWSSRWAFLMAAVGSAVGLGNIWKFPYVSGQGGGGAFVLVYLACAFLIGAPCLIAELSLGRRGQMSPVATMRKIAGEEGKSMLWGLLGWSGIIGAFIIISYYSLVGGWVLAYIGKAAMGFGGFDAAKASATFTHFISNPEQPIFYHFLFMGITVGIVARGVQGGLEKAVEVLMPALFVILLMLVVYSGVTGNFKAAVNFLFEPNFHKLTINSILNALGLAFFSLSLAMGSMMTYGSYLPKNVSIPKSAFIITASDSIVALLAGMAIFPIVFGYPGLEASGGPGLVFMTLPIAFGQMPLGSVFGTLFFALLAVAAITSSISLLEPPVSFIQERTGWSRTKVTTIMGTAAFLVGCLSSLGQEGSLLGNVHIFGLSIMDLKDYIASNILMPVGAMFMMIFVGWFVSRKSMMEELAMEDKSFRIWYFLVRYVCPIAIAVIFINIIYATVTG